MSTASFNADTSIKANLSLFFWIIVLLIVSYIILIYKLTIGIQLIKSKVIYLFPPKGIVLKSTDGVITHYLVDAEKEITF